MPQQRLGRIARLRRESTYPNTTEKSSYWEKSWFLSTEPIRIDAEQDAPIDELFASIVAYADRLKNIFQRIGMPSLAKLSESMVVWWIGRRVGWTNALLPRLGRPISTEAIACSTLMNSSPTIGWHLSIPRKRAIRYRHMFVMNFTSFRVGQVGLIDYSM